MDIRGSRLIVMSWANQGDLRQTRRNLKGVGGLFLTRITEVRFLVHLQLLVSPLSTTPRKAPFVVRGGRKKVLVSATLENRKENAYNTSLSLSFSRNLHLASLTPQVPLEEGIRGRREKGGGRRLGYWL